MKLIPTIGMETHVELKTKSKMFCSCKVEETEKPNTNLCPTCLGLPGALPIPNKKAIEMITLLGVSLDCEITENGMFHRKNYFYPDLPKNYQISQFDYPIGLNGVLQIVSDNEIFDIEVERVHMEEDTGKSIHVGGGRIDTAESTLLDFNRSGIPLVEIVTKPVISSSKHAVAYIEELRQLVIDIGISHGKLELGNLRFDANISVAHRDENELGVKVEIKNMNSLRSLERAIEYEIDRQTSLLEKNKKIIQETRHWDEKLQKTISMRTKEGSADYRYFSDPDIPNMNLSKEFIEEAVSNLPELPKDRRKRYLDLGLSLEESSHIVKSETWVRDLFEDVQVNVSNSRSAYLWTTGELLGQLRKLNLDEKPKHLIGENLAELICLVEEGKVSSSTAKEILGELIKSDLSPENYAKSNNLIQENDEDYINNLVSQIIKEHEKIVERIKLGEDKLVGFLIGEVMKESTASLNPGLVRELILKKTK
mgnify:CR=1 FL=1|jgi:aspartyl-tRNA(Asn)/glutamyl-tRNA(Gln) amidotransferase subunit B